MELKTTWPVTKAETKAPSTYKVSNQLPTQVSCVVIATLEPLTVALTRGEVICTHPGLGVGVAEAVGIAEGVGDGVTVGGGVGVGVRRRRGATIRLSVTATVLPTNEDGLLGSTRTSTAELLPA